MQQSIWRLSLKSLARGHNRGGVHVIVVIAEDSIRARTLAANSTTCTHDCPQTLDKYLNPELSDCTLIGYSIPDAEEGVQAVDFDYDYDAVKYPWIKG